jgi:hypothetical protein
MSQTCTLSLVLVHEFFSFLYPLHDIHTAPDDISEIDEGSGFSLPKSESRQSPPSREDTVSSRTLQVYRVSGISQGAGTADAALLMTLDAKFQDQSLAPASLAYEVVPGPSAFTDILCYVILDY